MKKLLLIALAFRLFLSFGPYHPDLGNHLDWGIKFWQIGPNNFYENQFWQVSWPNQPPGTIYLFALTRKIYEGIFAVFWWLNVNVPAFPSGLIPFIQEKLYVSLVKLPSILADVGIGYLIFKIVERLKSKKAGVMAAAVFLFNPVVWYNSAVWGQTDALINFLGLYAVYLFWKEKPFWGSFIFFLSLYFKGSLLIFTPVIIVLLLKSKIPPWKKAIALILPPLFLSYLSYPFVHWMSPVPWIFHLYQDRIFGHQGNMLTANAFNLWAFFYGIDFARNDLIVFAGLALKKWGQILFILSSVPVIINLFIRKIKIEVVLWSLAAIAIFSFFFLTNMHERYLYPAIPFLTILLGTRPRFRYFYLCFSLVFFLNLYHLWYVPDLFGLRFIYYPATIKILSLVNFVLLGWFSFEYFRFSRLKKL